MEASRGCCCFSLPESNNTVSKSRRSTGFAVATAASIFPNSEFTNHESLPSLQHSFAEFAKAYPQYLETDQIDHMRAHEYQHLSLSGYTCLDYIGTGLFSYSQLHKGMDFSVSYKTGDLKTQLLHGGQESELESAMKSRIMDFMNMSQKDYSMVFTANKTAAFKLLAESYPFRSHRRLLTVYDYESEAVEAMANSSKKRGARAMAAEFTWPRLRIHSAKLKKMIANKKRKGLFVFPIHSRISGTRYPYLWMSMAQEKGWHTMVDACALGPKDMASFGLSLFRPDFLTCSFYKVFGENPSGFACLFVKKSTIPVLESSSSAGIGIVGLVPFQRETEQGCRGLDQVDSMGLTKISNRARYLINWLVNALVKLHHPDTQGLRLVRIYGPKVKFDRGPALAFNLYDWKGDKLDPALVQKLADRNNISLGCGFLHHIFFPDKYEQDRLRVLEARANNKAGLGISVVTAALGFLVNFEDVYRLWTFVAQFLDADFVDKERWRYTSLNQKIIEI